ncbi:MAG TPA: hypothetical protein VFB54_14850 [Burkholderiales bacterium]|nr:hypothetical protein [Burkholderiales bacterium]
MHVRVIDPLVIDPLSVLYMAQRLEVQPIALDMNPKFERVLATV